LLVLAVASVALVGVGVSPASAAPVIDQTQTTGGGSQLRAESIFGLRAVDLGSTFVAGLTGSLTRIDIPVQGYSNTGTLLDAQVRVWTVNQITGRLAFPILATQVIPEATTRRMANSEFILTTTFDTPATVTAGTKYAFTVGFVSGVGTLDSTLAINAGTPGVDKTVVGIDGNVFTADPTKGISFTTYVDASAAPPAPTAPAPSLAKTGFDGQPYLVLVGGLLALGVIALGISSTLRRRAAKR
jgi:hypothetical protein